MFYRIFRDKILLFYILVLFFLHVTKLAHFSNSILKVALFIIGFGLLVFIYNSERSVKKLSEENTNLMQVLKQIFDYCPDSIFVKDIDKKFVAANKAMLRNFKLESEKDIVGKTDFDFLPQDMAGTFEQSEIKILSTLESDIGEFSYKSEGEERFIHYSKVPLVGEDGKITGLFCITRNVTSDKKCAEELKYYQMLFTSVIDNLPLSAYLRDFEGNVLYENAYCTNFCIGNGWKCVKDIFLEFYTENREQIQQSDKIVLESQKPISETRKYFIDDRGFYFQVHKIPVFEGDKITKVFVIAKDVTTDVEMEEQKESFVATLSHDLKTPTLAQIKALEFFSSGAQDRLTETEKDILREVNNSCKYMYSMINNLISTYKYNNGKINLKFEQFDLSELLKDCLSEIKYLCLEREQTFVLDYKDTKYEIYADRLEIKRVVINLLANAISYSSIGSTIKTVIEKNAGVTKFRVINNGKFVDDQDLETLFDKFVSNASRHKKVGTGLGLYLSKQIIELHDGKIFAKKQDESYVFGFELSSVNLSKNKKTIAPSL